MYLSSFFTNLTRTTNKEAWHKNTISNNVNFSLCSMIRQGGSFSKEGLGWSKCVAFIMQLYRLLQKPPSPNLTFERCRIFKRVFEQVIRIKVLLLRGERFCPSPRNEECGGYFKHLYKNPYLVTLRLRS